jgi:hypothetical protein
MKMKQAEFLTLSAFTMMLTALGIDIRLPAFGEVRKHFELPSSSNATAQIVSFVGIEMARTMSLIFAIFLSTSVFAPFLGIAILKFFSWRVVFMTPVVFAAIVFLWSTLRLEELLPK